MARHLAFDGIWGMSKEGFSSTSSSILWVLLLAAINRVVGLYELTPWLINVLSSVLVLVVFDRVLADLRYREMPRFGMFLPSSPASWRYRGSPCAGWSTLHRLRSVRLSRG